MSPTRFHLLTASLTCESLGTRQLLLLSTTPTWLDRHLQTLEKVQGLLDRQYFQYVGYVTLSNIWSRYAKFECTFELCSLLLWKTTPNLNRNHSRLIANQCLATLYVKMVRLSFEIMASNMTHMMWVTVRSTSVCIKWQMTWFIQGVSQAKWIYQQIKTTNPRPCYTSYLSTVTVMTLLCAQVYSAAELFIAGITTALHIFSTS